ncbi:MAG: ATP-binding cassette domain-containing protein [Rhodospirillaceae bacterium]|nr:ATP-binding cassette domain-containing protein [Rhodospirillaceae bacterium]
MPPPILQLSQARLAAGGTVLFDGLTLALGQGDRAALIGRNGAGKSTLLGVLAGRVALDAGELFVQPGKAVAELAQIPDFAGSTTVADYVAAGLPAHLAPEDHRVDIVLDELGLDGARNPATLSGGEARRAGLARALVVEPDLLLLDEPTNHLDLPTIEWLEDRLAGWRGALLVVSHDRMFLSRLTNRVVWLDRGTVRVRSDGFRDVEAWIEAAYAEEDATLARMDKRIASETKWLREGLTARRKRNMGRVRALSQLRAERRQRDGRPDAAKLAISEARSGGRIAIEAEGISKSFDGPDGPLRVVTGFSTRILRGDRVGVLGANGAGKTTLVRLLTGELAPDSGTVRHGTGLEIAYFDQSRASLDPALSVRRALLPDGGDQVHLAQGTRHIASYLRDFLFDPGRMDSPVSSLSGGERNRLLLARLFARPSNLLVMDEPTNDLDLETLDLLEDVLGDYAGTLLLVSHDRDFLDRLVTSVLAVEGGGRVDEYVGGWSDYARQRPALAVGKAAPAKPAPAARPAPAVAKPRQKLGFKEQRDLELLPTRIEALDAEIARLHAELADPTLFARDAKAFQAKSDRLHAAEADRTAAEDRWLEVATLAESLGTGPA